MTKQHRISVTVDADVLAAGRRAVATGRVASLSAWVRASLDANIGQERTVADLREAIEAFEREFGEITAAEMADQQRADDKNEPVRRRERDDTTPSPPNFGTSRG